MACTAPWPANFLQEVERVTLEFEGREQETRVLLGQVHWRCNSYPSTDLIQQPAQEDALVQQLVSLAKEGLAEDSEGPAFACLQNTVTALTELAIAETEETKRRFDEAMQALEVMLEKIFELSYTADLDLLEFEHGLAAQWEAKKLMCEHIASQLGALTGMTYAMRGTLKRHDDEAKRAAIRDGVAVLELGPRKEDSAQDVAPFCVPKSDPAYIPFAAGVDTSVWSTFIASAETTLLQSTSTSAEAEPAVVKGLSLAQFAPEPSHEVPAQATLEGLKEVARLTSDGDSVTKRAGRPDAGTLEQPDSCKERREQQEERLGWRSSEAPLDKPGEVPDTARGSISSNAIAGDHDSDALDGGNSFEYLLRHHAGSRKHATGDCKACHSQAGLCWKGLDCTFCHICPKTKRKSKHQRDVDKRRQERYLQVQSKLGDECCEVLATIDDGRRLMMSSSEDLKKQVKDAYQTRDPARIQQVNQIVNNIQHLVTAMAIEEEQDHVT